MKLKGTAGGEALIGSLSDDLIRGFAGDDWLYGAAGNDRMNGGKGGDYLYGGDGDDTVIGAVGDDELYGEAGADVLWGGRGNDLIYGGQDGSWDAGYGGTGDDQILVDHGVADGGDGNDVMRAELSGTRYSSQIGGGGADTFAFIVLPDGQNSVGVAEDWNGAEDRLSITTGFETTVLYSHDIFSALDTDANGLIDGADPWSAIGGAIAFPEANTLYLIVGDDLIALRNTVALADWQMV